MCRIHVMSMMTYKFLRSIYFYDMDGRKSRHIKDVLDCCREVDRCRRSVDEMGEVVENIRALSATAGNKSEKSWIFLKNKVYKKQVVKVTRRS